MPPDQRQPSDRLPRGRAGTAVVLVVALMFAGCAAPAGVDPTGGSAAPPAPTDVAPPLPGELVLVLPPSDRLDALEYARVRAGAARALDEALGSSRPFRIVSAPTLSSLGDVVEQAARSADVVCVLGPEARVTLEAALALYPQTIGCGLPAPSEGTVVLGIDVAMEALGLELGRAARAAAGNREVLVLSGGDPLHGTGWLAGVTAGAAGGPVRIVGSPDSVREELVRDGERAGAEEGSDGALRPARTSVGVVVLDASPGAAELALELLERRVLLVTPRAFVADLPDVASLVLRWRVRWDVPLTGLLRRATAAADGTLLPVGPGPTTSDSPFALEEGPAHVSPDADDVR